MIFTDCLNGRKTDKTPVWIMRQAGRYLPEYRQIRQKADDFISFCLSPEQACEVTLQPIRRYGFDAAIIFSDILLVPHIMGHPVSFVTGKGPILKPVESYAALNRLDEQAFRAQLQPVAEAVRRTKLQLPETTALIGFSGAPWTLMTYLTEGGSSRDFTKARAWLWERPGDSEALLSHLCDYICMFLSLQAEAGADVLMLFDSWAGAVPASRRQDIITEQHNRIIRQLRTSGITLPVISFPKGLGEGLVDYADRADIQGLGLDHYTDRRWAAQNIRKDIVLQGNLDPLCLVAGGDQLKREVDDIMQKFSGRGHIFNLGHGVVPQTPPENLARLVEMIRGA